MAARKQAASEPGNIAQVTALVPLEVRDRVDQLARQERVSRSEIGRRAITTYVERQRHNDD